MNGMIRARAVTDTVLLLFLLLWLALFAWRKTFSYVNLGGVYVIELVVLTGVLLFGLFVLIKPGLAFAIPADRRLKLVLGLAGVFVAYNLIRAGVSPEISAKGLIPGIYPLHFIIAVVLASNAGAGPLLFVARVLVVMLFLPPVVSYFNAFLIIPYFGIIEDPGATYIYALAMALALFLIRNKLWSFMLFSVYFVFAVLQFERGTFLNLIVACLVLLLGSGPRARLVLTRLLVFRFLVFVAALTLLAPVVIGLVFNVEGGRFLITPENLLAFFMSIISGETGLGGGLGGTRQHRLEMWGAIVRLVFSSPQTALFGFGYAGEVGDAINISFRAPHNGYITMLYRGGVIGLSLFLFFLFTLFVRLRRTMIKSAPGDPARRQATIGLLLLGALAGDALAGTILDSPFTSWLFYFQIGVVCVLGYRFSTGTLAPTARRSAPSGARRLARSLSGASNPRSSVIQPPLATD